MLCNSLNKYNFYNSLNIIFDLQLNIEYLELARTFLNFLFFFLDPYANGILCLQRILDHYKVLKSSWQIILNKLCKASK